MKQYAVIGASTFGKQILEELILLDCEIILIDKDPQVVEFFKNDVTAAYIADVINREVVEKLIPADIDAAVVDLGDKIEASILLTQYLGKLGVPNIIVKAETDQHGEILSIVGAHHVVFPNLEAAKRVTPLLVSNLLFDFLPFPGGLVMAETGVPSELIGRSIADTDIRRSRGINVTAFRKAEGEDYRFADPDYRLQENDVLIIVGEEENILRFAGLPSAPERRGAGRLFRRLFGR